MYRLINGDNRQILKQFPDNHFDSIVTDPPYGIDFLGKDWDANTGALETYEECLRVLKPGGHILAFSAPRTYHHLAVTLEQAGFEIRDQIMWIYSSGFPKSQDVGKSIDRSKNKGTFVKTGKTKVSGGPKENPNGPLPRTDETIYYPETDKAKQWAGWGTALKPAHEPIALARKPIKTSIAKNVQIHGTGALNIDATRIPYKDLKDMESAGLNWNETGYETGGPRFIGSGEENKKVDKPAEKKKKNINQEGRFPSNVIGEITEPYQKYFYCPKVSRAERHIGFEDPGPQTARERDADGNVLNRPAKKAGASATVLVEQFQLDSKGNNHPTVKPAHEPICLARKPIKTSIAKNVEKYGTGALNIDATRVPYASDYDLKHQEDIRRGQATADNGTNFFGSGTSQVDDITLQGRFPSNIIGEIEEEYQKYFYCPKVSRKERHTGSSENNHPTVKPVALMEYLIKLVTPPNGIVLDPFNGSGSTGMAAVGLGFDYVGIDLDPNYIEISKKRIDAWDQEQNPNLFRELFEDAVE